MRTTLTLDDDVAAMLRRLQESRSVSFKQLVNDALRRGAEDLLTDKPTEWKQYTFPQNLGPFTVPVADVSAVLAALDEEKDRQMLAHYEGRQAKDSPEDQ
jgi:hypothetical protein